MKPSKSLNWLLSVLFLFQSFYCACQSYGVTTVLQITPPYSSFIPDYIDPSNNQLSVIVTLNDFYEPVHEIKLKFRFEGPNYSIETGAYNYVPPISISPGIPQVITGADLAPYFALENLVFSGLDPQYYQQFKSLPEGPCQVCVEVVDYYNPNQIILGNLHCQNIWFSLSDPPILNMPFCGETVSQQDPQNVYFSWSPLHIDLDLMNPTIYRFELFEMRPSGIDPNMIAANAVPFYTHEGNEPFFLYSMMEPPLIEGASYVWRVQAKYADGREKFQNQGYSQICTFEYGSPNQDYLDQTLISLNSEGVSQRRGSAWWNFDPNIEEYEIEYRKSSGGNWFSKSNSATAININNLEPETSYDVRVRAKIENSTSDWSNTSTFVTDPALDYACNSTIFPPIPPDFEPATELIPTDIVQIGQFEMRIKSAEPTGTKPGEFRGLGTIQVPFLLMTLRVNFEDLLVDDDYIARQGNVLGITEGLTSWIESQEINNQDPIDLPGVIDSIEIQDSSIFIYLEDDTLTFNWENEPMVFQDNSGFQYSVFKDGRIVRESYLNFSMDQLEASSDYQIKFSPHQNQTYGFDEFKGNFNEVYEPILLADQSVYYVPWKSIDPGETDIIKAELICSYCNEDSVRFENEEGDLVSHIKIGSKTYQISLQNISENQSIYAYYQQDKIGKLNVKSYSEKHRELTIVNLTNSSVSQTNISQNLEKTFLQANIIWDIQYENANLNFDYGPDGLVQSPDASLMKKYSEEMRAIRDLYFQENPTASKNRHYLFVVPGFSNSSMNGYMVRGRSIGFITPSTNPRNIAHELAHGSGGLKHTFPEVEQGSSQNLMDYGSGKLLHKDQWKELRNPFVINWFDEEEDGMYAEDQVISYYENQEIWRPANSETAYPLIDGTILKINGVTEVLFEKYGRVTQFKIGSELYKAYYLKYISTQTGDANWVSAGYFNSTHYSFLESADQDGGWDNSEQEYANENRFWDFIGTEINDSIASFGLKKFNGSYFNCYCLHWAIVENPTSISNYESKKTHGNWILNEVQYPSSLSYEDCQGSECLDLSGFDLGEGKGSDLFYLIANQCPEDSLLVFYDLAVYINSISNGINIGFYTEVEQENKFYDYYLDHIYEGDLTDFFTANEIYSIDRFQHFFPLVSNGDKVISKVFSSHNLWDFLNESPNYNARSFDLTSFDYDQIQNYDFNSVQHILEIADYLESLLAYQQSQPMQFYTNSQLEKIQTYITNMRSDPELIMTNRLHNRSNILAILKFLGVFAPYEYDMNDLIMRRQIKKGGGALYTAITNHESAGEAVPLHSINEYDQYVARYGTEAAFYLGFQYMKMYVDVLWEPAAMLQALSKFQALFHNYKAARNSGLVRRFEDVVSGVPVGGSSSVSDMWKPGWDAQRVLDIPKGQRPDPSVYLKESYVSEHLGKFENEGGSFIVVKSWIEGGNPIFTSFPNRKFVGLKSEMDEVINRYSNSNNDWQVLRDELNLGSNVDLSNDEIYYITISPNDSRFSFDLPNGNEFGAIPSEWVPGGKTKFGTTEATLVGSENIIHNLDINLLLQNFEGSWTKIK